MGYVIYSENTTPVYFSGWAELCVFLDDMEDPARYAAEGITIEVCFKYDAVSGKVK